MRHYNSFHYVFLTFCLFEMLLNQANAQITPHRNSRNQITSIKIIDTIHFQGESFYVDTTVRIARQPVNYLTPNYIGKSMMTPTAWGTRGGILYGGIGGTFPQVAAHSNDLMAVAGLTLGDPVKYVGGSVTLNVNDVSKFSNFSTTIILNRHLTNSDAISVGGIHLLATEKSDSDPSYFFVYSHVFQTFLSKYAGAAALQVSIGVGSGRFYDKSHGEINPGHSKYGTAVFANLSYEVVKWMNINAEWSGTNLHAGISIRPLPAFPVINLGIADITRSSGSQPRFIASIFYSFPVWK